MGKSSAFLFPVARIASRSRCQRTFNCVEIRTSLRVKITTVNRPVMDPERADIHIPRAIITAFKSTGSGMRKTTWIWLDHFGCGGRLSRAG